ncbi:MAG: hypothetical protein WCC94_03580 [Candidatus Bathyarchaeia archaeon]
MSQLIHVAVVVPQRFFLIFAATVGTIDLMQNARWRPLEMKSKRIPFGLSHKEIELLTDTLRFDLTGMHDVLRDPGYNAKEQRNHRVYVRDLRNLLRRLRRLKRA